MFKNMWYFLALCFLGVVNAQNNTDAETQNPPSENDRQTTKVEATNISALYIGDLLRTKPKEVLETAGAVHQPIIFDRSFLPAALMADRALNYKTHGGHEYAGAEYIHPSTQQSRASVPVSVNRIGGTQARSAPMNVMGHLLTLKPVRLVKADVLPRSRSPPVGHPKAAHYESDDCSKSGEHSSYSSEEKPYVPEQQSYRRANQIAPGPEPEYRSPPPPPNSYSDEDRSDTYSQSDPSYGAYDSKSFATDTDSKSHSSGSYTKSKSTSTSKTVTPTKPKPVRIVPTVLSDHHQHHEENLGPAHGGDQGIVVYKVKQPQSQRPREGGEREYSPPTYEREQHKPREYSQYPPPSKKSRKHSQGGRKQYSSSERKERPQQYGTTAPYEQDKDSYDQSTYSTATQHRYREQGRPSSHYHEGEYAHTKDHDQQKPYYQTYKTSEGAVPYEAEQPSKPQLRKKYRGSTHYDRPSSEGREYKAREPATTEYSYPPEHQIQSSRAKKQGLPSSYDNFPSQNVHSEPAPTPQSYERTHPALRPSEEKQLNQQYSYEATPHHQPNENHRSHKRQYRESSRPARSPEKRAKPVVVEGRAHLSEPVVLVSRESKPYVSRSESRSESGFNMGPNGSPKVSFRENFDPFLKTTRGLQMEDIEHQTSYKPFNSEYPASYANDQHYKAQEQPPSHSYEQPHPYEAPPSHSQTQSYSGEGPQTYQEHDDVDDEDGSYEGGAPAKKGKNHHYISKIEGYKDTYGKNEPLTIDEEFFRKYGISPKAKVIVATVKNPNMFVADGSNIKEGEYFGLSSDPSSGPSPGPSSAPHSDEEEGSYEPDYKNYGHKEDSYNESPEELGPPREIPGSFDDLVDTNPKFLRQLPRLLKGEDSVFRMDSTEDSFDDMEFPKVEEQKGYVVSQGPGEIVQQHGDGVSRIIFNVPKGEPNAESSNVAKEETERISSAATKVITNRIKAEP